MAHRPRKFPIGTAVAFYPGGGHRPDAHWLGIVEEHLYAPDGKPWGLTNVRCTDPRGFLNNRVGQVTTVQTRKLRRLDSE
ncbi:hypothetical protein [Streptomyces sp. NBC_00212]|uniref:hypothetical protein n=1 Tax=Streptomyces sp. NBC_00212 TaxID=2975684 RepID=UPI002F909FF8